MVTPIVSSSDFPSTSSRRFWVMGPLGWIMPQQVSQYLPSIMGYTPNGKFASRLGFVFRINPVRIEFSMPKSRTLELTKSGFQNTIWFDKEMTLSITGTTGAFGPIPAGGIGLNLNSLSEVTLAFSDPFTGGGPGSFDITKSEAWANFEELQRVFDAGTQELYFLFSDDNITYYGVVNDFSFTQDAYDPFQIKWSMSFTCFVRQRMFNISGRDSVGDSAASLNNSFQTLKVSFRQFFEDPGGPFSKAERTGIQKNDPLWMLTQSWAQTRDAATSELPAYPKSPDEPLEVFKVESDG